MRAWFKRWWWTLVLGLAVVGVGLFFVFRRKKDKPPGESSFVSHARNKIREAETDALIAKARVKAKSEIDHEKLNVIDEIKDDDLRRRKLAEHLDGLL
jgi:LPXTG-motif cell wall-anchored protein